MQRPMVLCCSCNLCQRHKPSTALPTLPKLGWGWVLQDASRCSPFAHRSAEHPLPVVLGQFPLPTSSLCSQWTSLLWLRGVSPRCPMVAAEFFTFFQGGEVLPASPLKPAAARTLVPSTAMVLQKACHQAQVSVLRCAGMCPLRRADRGRGWQCFPRSELMSSMQEDHQPLSNMAQLSAEVRYRNTDT